MCSKPVGEHEVDALLNEVERIIDPYVETGSTAILSERCIRAAIMGNPSEKIATRLPIELRRAETVDDIQHNSMLI